MRVSLSYIQEFKFWEGFHSLGRPVDHTSRDRNLIVRWALMTFKSVSTPPSPIGFFPICKWWSRLQKFKRGIKSQISSVLQNICIEKRTALHDNANVSDMFQKQFTVHCFQKKCFVHSSMVKHYFSSNVSLFSQGIGEEHHLPWVSWGLGVRQCRVQASEWLTAQYDYYYRKNNQTDNWYARWFGEKQNSNVTPK